MFKKKSTTYRRDIGRRKELAWGRVSVFFIATAIVGLLLVLLYNPSNSSNSLVPAKNQLSTPDENHPLRSVDLPDSAQAAVGTLYEGVVMSNQTGNPIPIASITKIITALVVLDKAPLEVGQDGESILLQSKDEDYYWDYVSMGGTVTAVTAGETISTYQALQAMLLASSNNMSDTVVEHYFESIDEYLIAAKAYLQSNELSSTSVADTTGFSPDSRSTPEDLIRLGQLALNNPVIAEIVAQESAVINLAGEIPNYNSFIKEPNVTGLKPGFTDEAGATILLSADLPLPNGDTKTVIATVLGHRDELTYHQDVVTLLDQMRTVYGQ